VLAYAYIKAMKTKEKKRKTREKRRKKEKNRRKQMPNNGTLLVRGSVCVKSTCGQRRREKRRT